MALGASVVRPIGWRGRPDRQLRPRRGPGEARENIPPLLRRRGLDRDHGAGDDIGGIDDRATPFSIGEHAGGVDRKMEDQDRGQDKQGDLPRHGVRTEAAQEGFHRAATVGVNM
ncbi:hypothetical protein GGD83_003949 [Rhodoblastus sphagnicola]|uniref:hypothetical protein n=1 Tax=Rhodoblastus sphagnicola TaxID=333368 RepID=UPI001304A8EE|nr:hypothetical protein [Rhodoblastus sphagnicola]MBB4200122.1 hypothetical protein [Rhodoblastus sphagnicola]